MKKSTSAKKTNLNIPHIIDSAELGELSNSFLLESRLKQITGTIKVKGVASVKLSSLIKLVGFGKRFDGSIFVSSISHLKKTDDGTIAIINIGKKNSAINVFYKNSFLYFNYSEIFH